MFPPIPAWDAMHPIVIHFPIALLLIAPLFILMSLLWRPYARPFGYAALTLMLLGTISVYVAVATGEATGELAERGGTVEVVLEHHESLAEQTRTIFTVLTLVYAFVVLAPLFVKRALELLPWTIVNTAFLVFYLAGTLFLVNTAHEGGRLVHEFGVHALMPPTAPGTFPPSAGAETDDDDH